MPCSAARAHLGESPLERTSGAWHFPRSRDIHGACYQIVTRLGHSARRLPALAPRLT